MTKKARPRRADVDEVDLIGGDEIRELDVVDYDEAWPGIFGVHRDRLRQALVGAAVGIEHIGSTSVQGLAAKPIIDILVTVDDVTAEEDFLVPIVAAGYVVRVRAPGRRMVRTPDRDVHVHILEKGSAAADDYLLFRDRLRGDAGDRALYASTKRALIAQGFDDMNAYSDAKTEVVTAIMGRARAAG
jgi:GrpB-like predicted nucleotidyltransferase (UPF0157 family)